MTKSIFCPQARLVPIRRQRRDGSFGWHGRVSNAKLIRMGESAPYNTIRNKQKGLTTTCPYVSQELSITFIFWRYVRPSVA